MASLDKPHIFCYSKEMKQRSLAGYLEPLKAALVKEDYAGARRAGETALKQLPALAYSPLQEFQLYTRLGLAYHYLFDYARSVEILYKAYLLTLPAISGGVSTEKHTLPRISAGLPAGLEPVYPANISLLLANNFVAMKNYSQALAQLQKVEDYYRKYGDGHPQMDAKRRVGSLVNMAYCYLAKSDLAEANRILEEKLPAYQSVISTGIYFVDYHHFKGEYLMAMKKYNDAKLEFTDCIKASRQNDFPVGVIEAQIHLATIDLINGRLADAIAALEATYRDSSRLKLNYYICEAALLLSRAYTLDNESDKAAGLERRIKPLLYKLDIGWLYETIRQFSGLPGFLTGSHGSLQVKSPGSQDIFAPEVLVSAVKTRDETAYYRDTIIGASESMNEVFHLLEKIAPTDLPVLIQGETGTGKELIARAIHVKSPRADGRWLAFNCGAVPATLLESELFGHFRGAFTGAVDRKGYIESASGGTLFLDEIANMSIPMQQRLLRVLEEKQVYPLGAVRPVPVNTRFVFASNRNIREMVAAGAFRLDLYYRINVITVHLPPLRERKEDIPLLVEHFLRKYTDGLPIANSELRNSKSPIRMEFIPPKVGQSAMDILTTYPWPGNVRELGNEVKRILLLNKSADVITGEMVSEHIRLHRRDAEHAENSYSELKKEWERNLISQTLNKCKGDVSAAARELKLSRWGLYKKMKGLGITETTKASHRDKLQDESTK